MLKKIKLQLFGNSGQDDELQEGADGSENPENEEKDENGEKTDKTHTGKPETAGLPQTQEELDALINARIARERKNAARRKDLTQTEQSNQVQTTTETDTANESAREMLVVRAQLEAYKSNQIKSECVEDAVDLALASLSKEKKEATGEALKEAINTVLSRHPEWRPDDSQKGGFKVGSDGDNEGAQQLKQTEPQNKKRWNKWQ